MSKMYVVVKVENDADWEEPNISVVFTSPSKVLCERAIKQFDEIPMQKFVDSRYFYIDNVEFITDFQNLKSFIDKHLEGL